MNAQQKTELKETQRDIELIAKRLDVFLREEAMMVRGENQNLATRIDECRHTISGALNLPLNASSMMEAKERIAG